MRFTSLNQNIELKCVKTEIKKFHFEYLKSVDTEHE